MKKFLSVVLSAAIFASSGICAFAEDQMQSTLVSVKNKISVSDDFSEFETSKEESRDGKISYQFSWSDSENEKNMSVVSDEFGRILSYSYYNSEWYESESENRINVDFKIEDVINFADLKVREMLPELFENANDCAVMVPYTENLILNSRGSYRFEYVRKHDGIKVDDNSINVQIFKSKDGFDVRNLYVSWNYDASFNESKALNSKAEEQWRQNFPMKLQYRKTYDGKYILEYITNSEIYLDNDTLAEIKKDEPDQYNFVTEDADAESTFGSSGNLKQNSQLTSEELKSLESLEKTKTKAQLLQIIYDIEEFGVKEDCENILINIYPEEDKYKAIIGFEDEDFSASVTMDAISGEVESFYRYGLNRANNEAKNPQKAESFLKKYFGDKLNSSVKNEQSDKAQYTRLVNDIPYINNTISAVWNEDTNAIVSFSCIWDDDISACPSPENIFTLKQAQDIMYEKYPIELKYILCNKNYTLANTQSNYNVRIDAASGKFIDYSGEEQKATFAAYADTKGHWVEKTAKILADYGIRIEEETLKPDQKITQEEFLALIYNGVLGRSNNLDTDVLYRCAIDDKIISEAEKNNKNPISREVAIRYLLRAMGICEVAELEGIYLCDFKDSMDISPDKVGYCAIAKGFKIVNGDGGYLYPKNDITRAEALAMIYNYLTR